MSLTHMRSHVSLRTVAAAAALLFLLTGCVDLDDAVGLSKLSGEARLALPKVSNDIAATCFRQNTLLTDIPEKERSSNMQPQDCKSYQEVSTHLAKDESVLLDYFDALGKLSSNKPLSYDANIDKTVVGIGKNTALSADTAKAGTDAESILQSLADAATHGYREKQLGQIIAANDPAIQSLTQALKKVVTIDYGLLLSNEETSLDLFYQGPIDQAVASSTERLTLILVQRQYSEDKAAMRSRKDSIADYGKIMDDLAALHAKLKQQATQKSSLIEMGKQAGPIVESLSSAITDIQTRSK
jgi:hypothetical protein